MSEPFRVGVSSDFQIAAAGAIEPALKRIFDPLPQIEYEFFESPASGPVSAAVTAPYDGLLVLGTEFDERSFDPSSRTAILARWGVGYDRIDTEALTQNDVLLAITVDAVRRPVSEAIMTLLLALAKRLPQKDSIVRRAAWEERGDAFGLGIRGKTVGSVGMGNIGSDFFRLLAPFEAGRRLVSDPYLSPEQARTVDVELVSLKTLFAESDFVTVNCPLTEETQGMIDAELFGLMKPTAYFINTARGPIVDQEALIEVLQDGRIAGAGLDVFADEPLAADSPLLSLDNVILSPHALAWTDELYTLNGEHACANILSVFRGEIPPYPVNRAVLERLGFRRKLDNLSQKWA